MHYTKLRDPLMLGLDIKAINKRLIHGPFARKPKLFLAGFKIAITRIWFSFDTIQHLV